MSGETMGATIQSPDFRHRSRSVPQRALHFAVLAAASFLVTAQTTLREARAQSDWPSRPVTIIVPYSAGTAPDVIARQLADQLSSRIGQPVIVEDRAGAGGLVGTQYAAGTKPDGYSLFLGGMDTQTIIGHLYRNISIDPVAAFAGISLLGQVNNVVSASPVLNIHSMATLIDEGKKGRSFTFATPGVGSNPHLLGALLKQRTGVDFVHVPY
ncbi:MAG: tripartite tricarboxylate transporter substrate-binding protein, partial [Xanthobacteraceae bacterium]